MHFMKFDRVRIAGLALGLAASACTPLTAFNAVVPKDGGARLAVRDAAFGSDPRQRLDVYVPSDRPDGPRPIIVFFYGGSWSSGTKSGYSFVGRALASRGFVVAIPDYRLVPQVRYPTFLEDNAAAVRWVRDHAQEFGGDGDRLILAGHSAGAYDAAMLALNPRFLGPDRKAVRGLIGLAGPYDFLPFDGPVVQRTFGQVVEPAETQPVTYVSADDPPAFLATGDEDEMVRPANSDSLAAKLRSLGIQVERRRYSGVGHVGLITAVAKPLRGRASVLADMSEFAHRIAGQERLSAPAIRREGFRNRIAS